MVTATPCKVLLRTARRPADLFDISGGVECSHVRAYQVHMARDPQSPRHQHRRADRRRALFHHGPQSHEVIALSANGHVGMAAWAGSTDRRKAVAPELGLNLTQVRYVTRHDQTLLHLCLTPPADCATLAAQNIVPAGQRAASSPLTCARARRGHRLSALSAACAEHRPGRAGRRACSGARDHGARRLAVGHRPRPWLAGRTGLGSREPSDGS